MSKYSPAAPIAFIHPDPTIALIILLLLNFPCMHLALASPRSTLQYILWQDAVLLLCRVKQVNLAAHDRPAAASHTLHINLNHKLCPLRTPLARCSVALQMKVRHIFPHANTAATQKILFTMENDVRCRNTVHSGKHGSP